MPPLTSLLIDGRVPDSNYRQVVRRCSTRTKCRFKPSRGDVTSVKRQVEPQCNPFLKLSGFDTCPVEYADLLTERTRQPYVMMEAKRHDRRRPPMVMEPLAP